MAGDVRLPRMFFPGMPGLISADYTLSQGITPGVITLRLHPDLSNLARVGPITITDNVNTVVIPGCIVDKVDANFSASGYIYTVYLLDRRWMWRYGTISGHYNVPIVRVYDIPKVADTGQQLGNPPVPDQTVFPDQYVPQIQWWTKATARDLARLLLYAMGESVSGSVGNLVKRKIIYPGGIESPRQSVPLGSLTIDVNEIPDNQYPEVNWDVANAAVELERLCSLYGCRVTYRPDLDKAVIVRLGKGGPLPEPGASELNQESDGIDPPELPEQITVYGAPARYQVMFQLEAVGMDFDGRVKRLDNLSYTPRLGWSSITEPEQTLLGGLQQANFFRDPLPAGRTAKDAAALAGRCVYRWYRIRNTVPDQFDGKGGFLIPVDKGPGDTVGGVVSNDGGRIDMVDIILTPFTNEVQVDQFAQRNLQPARLYGRCYLGGLVRGVGTTGPTDRVRRGFTVDEEHFLIVLDEPAYIINGKKPGQNDDNVLILPGLSKNKTYPAELMLETAIMIRDANNHQVYRYAKTFRLAPKSKRKIDSKKGVPNELAVLREEVRYNYRQNYGINGDLFVPNTVVTNKPEADNKANFFLQAEIARLQTPTPQRRVYNGVKPVFVDGAIYQVTWSLSSGGTTTTASLHNEHSVFIAPYATRMAREVASVENARRDAERDLQINKMLNGLRQKDGLPPYTSAPQIG